MDRFKENDEEKRLIPSPSDNEEFFDAHSEESLYVSETASLAPSITERIMDIQKSNPFSLIPSIVLYAFAMAMVFGPFQQTLIETACSTILPGASHAVCAKNHTVQVMNSPHPHIKHLENHHPLQHAKHLRNEPFLLGNHPLTTKTRDPPSKAYNHPLNHGFILPLTS